MFRVISVVKRPLVAELSLLLHELGVMYNGFVLSDNGKSSDNVAVVPMGYGTKLPMLSANVAFFPECDGDLVPYVHEAMRANVPVVMYSGCKVVPVEHDKTGMLYGNCVWATKWIRELCENDVLRTRIISGARESLNKIGT
jgi:hypothetical protein